MTDKNLPKYTSALNDLKAICEANGPIDGQEKFMRLYGVSSYFFQALFKLEIIRKTGTPNVYQWLHRKADNETPWLIAMNVQARVREIQQAYTDKSRKNKGLPAKVIRVRKPFDAKALLEDWRKQSTDDLINEHIETRTDSHEELERDLAERDSLVGKTTVSAEYFGNMTLNAAVDKLKALALRKAISGLRITIEYVG